MSDKPEIGVVTIHGFTGYPEEMELLGHYLENKGFYWENVKLPGHTTTPEDLKKYSWKDWAAEVMKTIQKTKKQVRNGVFVSGLSLGGLLTLYSLIHDPEIRGGITLAAPIKIFKWYHQLISPLPVGFWVKNPGDPKASLNDPSLRENHRSYEYFHSKSAKDVNNLAKHVKKRLHLIKAPILIVHSSKDKLVEPSNANKIFDLVSSEKKFLLMVNRSSHVLSKDYDRYFIFDTIVRFIQEVLEE